MNQCLNIKKILNFFLQNVKFIEFTILPNIFPAIPIPFRMSSDKLRWIVELFTKIGRFINAFNKNIAPNVRNEAILRKNFHLNRKTVENVKFRLISTSTLMWMAKKTTNFTTWREQYMLWHKTMSQTYFF